MQACSTTGRDGGSVLVILTEAQAHVALSFRNLARVSVLPSTEAGVADIIGAVDAARLRGRARRSSTARAKGEPQRRRDGGGRLIMDPTQVIIRPVVSEKSYVLSANDRYTFRVHPDAHKTQIRQAVEELFDVKVVEVRTHVGQVQAQAPRLHVRPHAAVEEGDRAGARR